MANLTSSISAIRASNLPIADSSSFYTGIEPNLSDNPIFDKESSLILCHKYNDSNNSNIYYYKSEQILMEDLAKYVIFKYKSGLVTNEADTYTGSFTGIFTHNGDSDDYVYGTSSGCFYGFAELTSSLIKNSLLNGCILDYSSTLNNTKVNGIKGTFTGSLDGSTVNITNVTYCGKALEAVHADKADFADTCNRATTATYAEKFAGKIDSVERANYANSAKYAETTNTCNKATTSDLATHATTADSAKTAEYAAVAEYAKGVSLDAYPIGYCDYIRMVPLQSNITENCNTIATNIDCKTYKWIKFKCKSDGYYTLTFDFLALRLSQYKSTAGPIPYADGTDAKGNPKYQPVYYADPTDDSARRGQSITSLLYNISDGGVGGIVENANKNNFGTIIQFQSAAGEGYEQKCPETIQSRNIIYNVKLEKDKEYLFVNNYFPYRPDFMTDSSLEYFPNAPAVGLYYKIANVGYGKDNIIINFLNYNNYESENFSSYMGPILEIRKVGNIATSSE